MSFQATYAVANLDLDNTYNKAGESKEITGRQDISKGTFSFWLNIDKEKVRIQISKDYVNIWHSEEFYVNGAFEKLKPIVVDVDGEKCEYWVLTNKQRIGSTSMATSLTKEVGLSHKIEEADYDDVTVHIEALQNEENPAVLEFRIGKILKIARSKRIAHIPEVLPFFEIALKDAKYQHTKVLRGLIDVFTAILGLERYYTPLNYSDVIETIQGTALDSIVRISENKTEVEVLVGSIYFLKLTDREQSVEAVFKIIKETENEPYGRLKGFIVDALFRSDSTLRNTQEKLINKNIDELLKSSDPKVRDRARELSERVY